MPKVDYKIMERRQKTYVKTYLILCLFLVTVIGFYSYKKWVEYRHVRDGLEASTEFIALLRDEVSNEKAAYDSQKDEFSQLNKDVEKKLDSIFPLTDNYTALTRQIDLYETELAKKNDPFEVSNIDFQNPLEPEKYSVLPLSMNIHSSSKNFTEFLHLVENSGALNSNVRLMDISSIRLNFEEPDEETNQDLINFSVQINAYFQK